MSPSYQPDELTYAENPARDRPTIRRVGMIEASAIHLGDAMRVSERGQITIPKRLRDQFGMHHNVEVEITPTDDGLLIRRCAAADPIRTVRPSKRPAASTETLTINLQGWLKTVDWDRRTAQLHEYGGGFVPLRFSLELDQDMRRLATQYVEVRGRGELNEQDKWTVVQVEELLETRSHFTPFDLDAFLNDPNPKLFDPDHMVTASEPFDVDEFIRTIYEGRRE